MPTPQSDQKKRQLAHIVFESGSKLVRIVQLPIILGAVIMLIFILGETLTMDWRLSFVYNRGRESVSDRVVIAAIDEETVYYDFIQEGRSYSPLDRSFLDSLINAIEEYQPAIIGLDILLEAPSGNPDTDDRLSRTLAAYSNIVIGSSLFTPASGSPIEFVPHPMFANGNTLTGFANITGMGPGQGTTRMRQYRLLEEASGEFIPSLAYALFLGYIYSIENAGKYLSQDFLRSALQEAQGAQTPISMKAGFNPREEFYVNYSTDAPLVVSAHHIYHRFVNPAALRDKIVLVGASSERFNDNFETSVGRLPGVMIHGQIISNLLNGQVLRHPTMGLQLLYAGIFFVIGFLFMVWKGVSRGLRYTWILLSVYWAGAFILFWIYPTLWLPMNSPGLMVIGLTLGIFLLNDLHPEWREKLNEISRTKINPPQGI